MRSAVPPKAARWLLEHFGCSPNNATVIGDLDERYRTGRSTAWYWRQVAVAIVVSFAQEVWNHKLLTVRAIVTGWIVFVGSLYWLNVVRDLLLRLESWSKLWRHGWITPAVQIPQIFVFAVLAGWLIAKLHRRSRNAMVLAYAAYFAAVQVVGFVPVVMRGASFQRFIYGMLFLVMTVIGILAGGGVFTSREDGNRSERNCATV